MDGLGFLLPLAIAFLSLTATHIGSPAWSRPGQGPGPHTHRRGGPACCRPVKVGLLQAFEPLQRIGAWWLLQGRPLAPEDWENDAKLFVNTRATAATGGLDRSQERPFLDRPPRLSAQPRHRRNTRSRAFERPATPRAAPTPRRSPRSSISKASPWFTPASPVRKGQQLVGYIAGLYDAEQLIRSLLQNQLPDQYTIVVTAGGRDFRVPPARGKPGARRIPTLGTCTDCQCPMVRHGRPLPKSALSTLQQSVMSFGVLASALLFICAVIARTSRRRAADLEPSIRVW